jgi:hypothetical protein
MSRIRAVSLIQRVAGLYRLTNRLFEKILQPDFLNLLLCKSCPASSRAYMNRERFFSPKVFLPAKITKVRQT